MIEIETDITTMIVIKIAKEIVSMTKTEIVTEIAQGAETIVLTGNLIISLNKIKLTTEKSTTRKWPMQQPTKQKTN